MHASIWFRCKSHVCISRIQSERRFYALISHFFLNLFFFGFCSTTKAQTVETGLNGLTRISLLIPRLMLTGPLFMIVSKSYDVDA